MKVCAAGYALTYAATLKLQLVSWTVVGLNDAKFNPLIFTMPGFSLSSTTYNLDLHGLGLLLPVACII
jgi:hypothetical protein